MFQLYNNIFNDITISCYNSISLYIYYNNTEYLLCLIYYTYKRRRIYEEGQPGFIAPLYDPIRPLQRKFLVRFFDIQVLIVNGSYKL